MANSEVTAERHPTSTSWLGFLTLMTLLHTGAFLAVTVWQFQEIHDLEVKDTELQHGLQNLLELLADQSGGDTTPGRVRSGDASGGQKGDKGRQSEHAENRRINHNVAKRQTSFITEILKAQEAIFEKHCHDLNKTCPPGALGDPGLPGDTGTTGTAGDPGLPGIIGDPGALGLPGESGLHGDPGLQGDPGRAGSQGPPGAKGRQGSPGPVGLTGSNGTKGSSGDAGIKGDGGDSGPRGSQGHLGVQGLAGSKGDPGPPGPQGDLGARGPPGLDVKLLPDGCECLKKPAFIVSADQTIDVPASGNQALPCAAIGNPPPVIHARKDHSIGKRRTTDQVISPARRTLVTANNSVSIKNASPKTDYGRYICEATNLFGTATKVVNVRNPVPG